MSAPPSLSQDLLARGINIETINTVVNLELPEGRTAGSSGGKGGKGGKGGGGGAVGLEDTYVHRLGRCTRSETAAGVCINIVGGQEELVAGDANKGTRLLQALKTSAHPNLRAFGQHYEVPRDIFRADTTMEVRVGDGNGVPFKWVELPVTVNRSGEDWMAWTVSFTYEGVLSENVPITHELVHVPFDYVALDEEVRGGANHHHPDPPPPHAH